MSTTFDHEFSGWSVWIEPCSTESSSLVEEIRELRERCSGSERGVHDFAPHCTLLYNVRLSSRHSSSFSENDVDDDDDEISSSAGEELLQRCVAEFRRLDDGDDDETTRTSAGRRRRPLTIAPTSLYHFHYPKTADDGRGFGCFVLLLLIDDDDDDDDESSSCSRLRRLQRSARRVFPPDERHGTSSGEEEEEEETPRFRPHVSLCYAPESETWTKDWPTSVDEKKRSRLLRPLPARWLSLWRTRGRVSEWRRVARVEL